MPPRRICQWAGLAGVLAFGMPASAAAAAPDVVVSIKPVHSLVAGVMTGIDEPALLVKGAGSPHAYSLRPSEAEALAEADVVFWVGDGLETFLHKPLGALAPDARVVELAELDGIALLPAREGGAWETHAQAEEEHGEHDHEHEHDEHADHDDTDEVEHREAHAEHDHGEHDLHIWLDPANAVQMVEVSADILSEVDPENASRYRANAERMTERLRALDAEIGAALAPVRDVPFIVFHDAYHYFEARYGLNAAGSITLNPERAPGAKRLYEIRSKLLELGASCVFSEPQFEPALITTVVEGTSAGTGALDPLGAEIAAGPDAYFELMRELTATFVDCLSSAN